MNRLLFFICNYSAPSASSRAARVTAIGATLAASLWLSLTGAGATAAFAAADGPPAEQPRYCQMVVDKPLPGESMARVLSYECATERDQLVAPQARTLLMTWYQHADYNQHTKGWSTRIYGKYGPCDSEGYNIPVVYQPWRESLSSLKVWNRCHWTNLFTEPNFGGWESGWHYGNWNYFGPPWNDNVGSILVHE